MISVNDLNGKNEVILNVESICKLGGGKKNEMLNRVKKKYKVKVDLSSKGMYEERMKELDKDFVVKERRWGVRVGDSCVIENKDKNYVECFIKDFIGDVKYYLDGDEIKKDDVVGLKESVKNDVGLVSYGFDSIVSVDDVVS
jgi:hypothetical protein